MKKSFLFIFLSVYSLFFGLTHWFAFQVASRSITQFNIKFCLGLVFILGWIAMPLGMIFSHTKKPKFKWVTWIGYTWMGFFTILMLFVLIEFFLVLFSTSLANHNYSYWILIIAFLISVYALYQGLREPQMIYHKMSGHEKLRGLKVAQISDVHLGMLNLDRTWFERILKRINQENPHVLTITGDMTDAAFENVVPILKGLTVLDHKISTYYITGNHEYINPGDWENELRKYGVIPLHNDHRIFNYNAAKVLFAGIPDITVTRFGKSYESNPNLALKTTEAVDYRILLAHQPTAAYRVKENTCDLVLSGHTHGGQIFPFHIFVRMAMPVLKGFKKINDVLVFTHQGTGFWGPPMRWFSRSEVVIFEWI